MKIIIYKNMVACAIHSYIVHPRVYKTIGYLIVYITLEMAVINSRKG